MADKDFQELNLVGNGSDGDLVGSPGIVSVTGTFDGATVTLAPSDDPIAPLTTFTAIGSQNVQAQRLNFSLAGGGGSEDVRIRWTPVATPY